MNKNIIIWLWVSAFVFMTFLMEIIGYYSWGELLFSVLNRSDKVAMLWLFCILLAYITFIGTCTLKWLQRVKDLRTEPKAKINWNKGLLRLYTIWPIVALAIVFYLGRYFWEMSWVQIGTLTALPVILHFPVRWLFRFVIVPVKKWIIRGFMEQD